MSDGTPLTGSRSGSKRIVSRDYRDIAANAKVWKGALAVCITSGTSKGYYAPANGDLIATAVGRFRQSVDNTGGADGDVQAEVDFFRDRVLFLLDNDDGTALDATDREQLCYALDDHTATAGVTTCDAGMLYDVTDEGVWVEISDPQGESGDATGLSNVAPVDASSTAASAGAAALASRQDHKHHIAVATPAAEGLMSAAYASAIHQVVATMTAMKAIVAAARADGMICGVQVGTGGGFELWQFSAASAAADATSSLVATPAAGTGRWLRADTEVALTLPATFATADATALFTVPAGARLRPRDAWWEVGTNWTGGASSAIGLDTSVAGWNTEGDVLGGAAGDVAATLVTTNTRMCGTLGTKLDAHTHDRLILIAGDTINFNRITSAFTAGAGNARVLCDVLQNVGA